MKELKPFWREKKGKVDLLPLEFLKEFMNDTGFRYDKESKSILKTTDTNKTLYEVVDTPEVYRYVLEFFEKTDRDYFNKVGGKFYVENLDYDDVLKCWVQKGHGFLGSTLKSYILLKVFKPSNLFRDTHKECFLSFQNGVVRITKDNIELMNFDVVGDKYRYTNSLIHRIEQVKQHWNGVIDIKDSSDGEFEMMCKVSTSLPNNPDDDSFSDSNPPLYGKDYHLNQMGLDTLMSGIGFQIHRKNSDGDMKLVLLQDRVMDGKTRNGGNGKSLISNALRLIQDVQEVHCESQTEKRFINSEVRLGTRTIFYDEIHPKNGYTLSDMYSNITSQVTIEKKHGNKVTLRGDDVPKLLGGSNYMVYDPNSKSDMRRLHIVEFSDLGSFHKGSINKSWGSDKSLFGSHDDWVKKDWNEFYNFLFRCVQLYLKEGLMKDDNPYWETSVMYGELYNDYGKPEVNWGITWMETVRKVKNYHIEKSCPFSYQIFNSLNNELSDSRLNEIRMKQMFFDLCVQLGYEYNPTKSHNGNTPNSRKIQRTDKLSGKQQHCIHITHSKD